MSHVWPYLQVWLHQETQRRRRIWNMGAAWLAHCSADGRGCIALVTWKLWMGLPPMMWYSFPFLFKFFFNLEPILFKSVSHKMRHCSHFYVYSPAALGPSTLLCSCHLRHPLNLFTSRNSWCNFPKEPTALGERSKQNKAQSSFNFCGSSI